MNSHDHQVNDVPRFNKGTTSFKGKNKRKSNDKSLKVVYISSPMKVKTSASRFRALVQKLTGKNSDISQYTESERYDAMNFLDLEFDEDVCINGGPGRVTSENNQLLSSENTPLSSDSFLGHMDNVLSSQFDEQFGGIFSSNISFCDYSHDLDVLGSYDQHL